VFPVASLRTRWSLVPVYGASLLSDWGFAVARWWSLFVIVAATIVSITLSERERKHEGRSEPRHRQRSA
jgi:hypothetical protein